MTIATRAAQTHDDFLAISNSLSDRERLLALCADMLNIHDAIGSRTIYTNSCRWRN
ncbi:hypothetical protein [Mycobacterium simiae]|uniref:hypothetical protein n=1 Tax=Mycobacterium simiae TaxID=1784 RepID=UPI00165FD7A2|nr:hypothetical protein [Mycobacterium simiae]